MLGLHSGCWTVALALLSVGQVSVVCMCVFSVQLLISCRLYTDCCAHVADNPWHCDCDGMYTVYRTFREESGQNVTLLCKSPANLMGKSWDVLEEKCQSTVAPPQPTVTDSTAKITAVNASWPALFSTTVLQNGSSTEASHFFLEFQVTFVVCFAVAVLIAVVLIAIVIRRVRSSKLNHMWWEDVVTRRELMSR